MTHSTLGMIEVSTNEDISRNDQVRAFDADAEIFGNNLDLNIRPAAQTPAHDSTLEFFLFQVGR